MPLACHPLVSKVGGGGREEGVVFAAELCLPYLPLPLLRKKKGGKKKQRRRKAAYIWLSGG